VNAIRSKLIRTGIVAAVLAASAVCPLWAQEIGRLEVPPHDTSLDEVRQMIAARGYSEAEVELARLLLGSPNDPELLVLQALNFFYEHNYKDSRRIVARLIDAHSATAEVRVLSGLLYVVANDLGSAEKEFRTAAGEDSNNAAAHYYLGRTLYMRQAIDASVIEFKRALALDANFIQAYDALGLAYFVKEDSIQAQVWFERGMQKEQIRGGPKMEWLRLDLATMLLTIQRAGEAAGYLAEAERINPANSQVYVELGQLYFQERRYPDALAAYGQVLKLDPSNALAHYFRGRAYHLLKEDGRAREEFQWFVTLNRQHTMNETTSSMTSPHYSTDGELNEPIH
jgi:tetratricopeptide (TPR) repeat protein